VGDTVRNVSADGEVVTIQAGDSFEVLGRAPLGETCRATPAVIGQRMVFRTAGRLLALDAEGGQAADRGQASDSSGAAR